MQNDDRLRVRRAIMRLTEKPNGSAVTITCGPELVEAVKDEAVSFAKSRKLGVTISTVELGVQVLRDDDMLAANRGRWPEIAKLDVGGEHLFEVVAADVNRIRMAASKVGVRSGRVYSCERVPTGVIVRCMREALSTPLRKRVGTGIDLSPLDAGRAIDEGRRVVNALRFKGYERIALVRAAASAAQRLYGWTLYCTAAQDGTAITVYRLDNLVVENSEPTDGVQGPDGMGAANL